MKITRQLVADQIARHFHGDLSQGDLVDWAERALLDAEFEPAEIELLSETVKKVSE